MAHSCIYETRPKTYSKVRLKQGQPYIWFSYIIGFLMIGFVFTLLSYAVKYVYDAMVYNNAVIVGDTLLETFATQSITIWIWLPLVSVISLIIWALIIAHKKRTYEGF